MANTAIIGGYTCRCSALTPILYKEATRRDLLTDYTAMQKAAKKLAKGGDEESALSYINIEMVAALYWVMAKQGEPERVPDNWRTFLDELPDVLNIYEIWPEVVTLWNGSTETAVAAKKK